MTVSFSRPEVLAWSKHWSHQNQQSFVQRCFSVYRKAVTARTVAWYVDRYLPQTGVLLEAGSGTSETSLRINKRGGQRRLIALDIYPPVLQACHPIMDVRLGGDIFRLPFADDSLPGIWNVGVMEHFTPVEIDSILGEFHRVLRPGGRLFLLWPGIDSLPQRFLRLTERVINLRRNDEPFLFHPPEISKLRSVQEGRAILERNGFTLLCSDPGPRSAWAFKALVAEKAQTRSSDSTL